MKPFEVSRLRLERAKAHGEALAKIWNEIPDGRLLSLRVRAEVTTGQGSIEAKANVVPDDFSLLLGEQLYQLRSALDACIYQATIYATRKNPPPEENKLLFPICSDLKEFEKQAKLRLSRLPLAVQCGIERVQPYNTPANLPSEEMVKNINRSLGILNDLARKDRHRKLHVVGSWPYHFKPEFTEIPPGVTVHDLRVMPPSLLKGDASTLATFRLQGWSGFDPIKVNPWLSTQIGCNEPPIPINANDTFDRRLVEMINAVHSVITAFENHF